jgi:hypothetical protein
LTRYIEEAREAGARSTLITPMTRRVSMPEGKIKPNLSTKGPR